METVTYIGPDSSFIVRDGIAKREMLAGVPVELSNRTAERLLDEPDHEFRFDGSDLASAPAPELSPEVDLDPETAETNPSEDEN